LLDQMEVPVPLVGRVLLDTPDLLEILEQRVLVGQMDHLVHQDQVDYQDLLARREPMDKLEQQEVLVWPVDLV